MQILKSKIVHKNGLKIVFISNPIFTSTTIGIIMKIGSANDFKGKSGCAFLTMHLLLFSSLNKIYLEKLKQIGAKIRYKIDKESSHIFVEDTMHNTVEIVEILIKIVSNCEFTEEDLEIAKLVADNFSKKQYDNIDDLIKSLVFESVYTRQVVGRSISGKEKTIFSITSNDIKEFHRRYYHALNYYLSCTGANIYKELYQEVTDVVGNNLFSYKDNKSVLLTAFKKYIYHQKNKNIYRHSKRSIICFAFPMTGSREYQQHIYYKMIHDLIEEYLYTPLLKQKYDLKVKTVKYNSSGIIYIYISISNKENIDEVMKDFYLRVVNFSVTSNQIEKIKNTTIQKIIFTTNNSYDTAIDANYHILNVRKSKKYLFDFEIIKIANQDIIMNLIHQIFDKSKISIFFIGPKKDSIILK